MTDSLTNWTDAEVLFAANLNGNFVALINMALLNAIRAVKESSATQFNTDGAIYDLYAEAYTDSDGALDTVNTSNTTASFDTDSYRTISTFTVTGSEEGTSFSTALNTLSTITTTMTINTKGIFTSIIVNRTTTGTGTITITKNGVTVASDTLTAGTGDETYTFTASDYSDYLYPGDTVTVVIATTGAVRAAISNQTYNGTLFTITNQPVASDTSGNEYGFTEVALSTGTGLVEHTIPSGTFNSVISGAFACCLINTTEAGATLSYKLSNTTESTEWLNFNEYCNFKAFTSEPTKFIVRMISASSPTDYVPSIYGASCTAR